MVSKDGLKRCFREMAQGFSAWTKEGEMDEKIKLTATVHGAG
jgi:hypothetical protein